MNDASRRAIADELRSRMHADLEFIADIRTGWEQGIRGEGMPVEEYWRSRGLVRDERPLRVTT